MSVRVWMCAAMCALALAGAGARRPDHDFEFAEDAATGRRDDSTALQEGRRPRRYLYEPLNPLCQTLVCKQREVCVLRDAFTALCADRGELLRRGDSLVAGGGARPPDPEDDVFYDEGAREPAPDAEPGDRCVGCEARARGEFLCGSDNRTYSSLCRLDLHNCVHRSRRPVALACRGFCPCRARARRPRPRPARRRDPAHDKLPLPRAPDCALDEMANRLLDWFSVLMDEAGAPAPPATGFPSECKPETRWMFLHLDADGDGLLSAPELYSLRHDERERCLRPFLSSCGAGAGRGGVSRAAWCGCLRRAARPCTALARAHPAPRAGAYVPACDARGYYRPRQCHAALGVCWCVDPHGVELAGSRGKGAAPCPGDGGGEGAPADDEDAGGSGDRDAHY